jgi:hypothetical protein
MAKELLHTGLPFLGQKELEVRNLPLGQLRGEN